MSKVRIIVVDDHEFFRKGLTLSINKLDYAEVVGEAGNGIEFLDLINIVKADVVFMDIKMPVMNGIEATKKALETNRNLRVIALSMFEEKEYILQMIEAGAKGYLFKKAINNELDHAVKNLISGKHYYSDGVSQKLLV